MIAVVDNGDLFTHNIVQLAGALGADATVVPADASALEKLQPRGIILASGVGTPGRSSEVKAVVEGWAGRTPILGVGLGMLCIASCFGARVAPSTAPMHGKASIVRHDGAGLFHGVPSPFAATRYDSLVVDPETLPECLAVAAEAEETGEIMALRHVSLPVAGVQFHPESAFTEHGEKIVENFLAAAGAARSRRRAV